MIYDDLELMDEKEDWLEDISDDDSRVERCPMCREYFPNCTCERDQFLDDFSSDLFD